MNAANILKWLGIVDGAVMAAAAKVGSAYPPAQPVTSAIIEVGGVLGTCFGGLVAALAPGGKS